MTWPPIGWGEYSLTLFQDDYSRGPKWFRRLALVANVVIRWQGQLAPRSGQPRRRMARFCQKPWPGKVLDGICKLLRRKSGVCYRAGAIFPFEAYINVR